MCLLEILPENSVHQTSTPLVDDPQKATYLVYFTIPTEANQFLVCDILVLCKGIIKILRQGVDRRHRYLCVWSAESLFTRGRMKKPPLSLFRGRAFEAVAMHSNSFLHMVSSQSHHVKGWLQLLIRIEISIWNDVEKKSRRSFQRIFSIDKLTNGPFRDC